MTFFSFYVANNRILWKRKSRKSDQCSQESARHYPTINDLPSHILIDILSRLPVKAILISRCVSKTWLTLISDPLFARLHLSRATAHVELFLRTDSASCSSRTLHWVDLESFPSAHTQINARFYLPKRVRKVKDKTQRGYDIVNSCNGFLCLSKNRFRNPCIICNPITGEYMVIPKPEKDSNMTRFVISGFGYCVKSNQYKVLRLVFNKLLQRMVEVHTLGTASWRTLGYANRAPVGGSFPTYLNGVIHWACDDFDNYTSEFIVAFDFEDERFCVVPGPPHFAEKRSKREIFEQINMGVLGGCLCVCDVTYSTRFDIWVMKDYGVQESWTKQFAINNYSPRVCRPLKYFGNEGVLMFCRRPNLVLYNPVEENIRYLSIYEAHSVIFEAITHMPSFLSLRDAVGVDGLEVQNVKSMCLEFEPQEEVETLLLVERSKL